MVMQKLTKEDMQEARVDMDLLIEGEQYLVDGNIVRFADFVERRLPFLPHPDQLINQVENFIEDGNVTDAVRMWHHVMYAYGGNSMRLSKGIARIAWNILWWTFIIGGMIGGWWFLIEKWSQK